MIELIKLFLSHLVGDFFLQSSGGIKQKKSKKWKSKYLYWHCLVHFVLIILIFWDIQLWPLALFISLMHLLIDGLKLSFSNKSNERKWFFGDQLAHILILVISWKIFFDYDIGYVPGIEFWIILAGFIFILNPSGYVIQMILTRWEKEVEKDQEQSLSMAGKTIGILERSLIFISILSGYPTAIGFLIAAKSIFRFGDLTRAKDRKLTEFILIGTFISFLLAILAGGVVKTVLDANF